MIFAVTKLDIMFEWYALHWVQVVLPYLNMCLPSLKELVRCSLHVAAGFGTKQRWYAERFLNFCAVASNTVMFYMERHEESQNTTFNSLCFSAAEAGHVGMCFTYCINTVVWSVICTRRSMYSKVYYVCMIPVRGRTHRSPRRILKRIWKCFNYAPFFLRPLWDFLENTVGSISPPPTQCLYRFTYLYFRPLQKKYCDSIDCIKYQCVYRFPYDSMIINSNTYPKVSIMYHTYSTLASSTHPSIWSTPSAARSCSIIFKGIPNLVSRKPRD